MTLFAQYAATDANLNMSLITNYSLTDMNNQISDYIEMLRSYRESALKAADLWDQLEQLNHNLIVHFTEMGSPRKAVEHRKAARYAREEAAKEINVAAELEAQIHDLEAPLRLFENEHIVELYQAHDCPTKPDAHCFVCEEYGLMMEQKPREVLL